jgi:UDP-2,4-diacetamido-2,4,6-trideoxy-beta-L-altropyranose hydrolase
VNGSLEVDENQFFEILKKNSAQIVVVDNYGLGKAWEQRLYNYVNNVLVIDDLANREHSCNALIDHNVGRKVEDYEKLVNREAALLIGPEYALLRDEFICHRKKYSEVIEGANKYTPEDELKILISMGGVDSNNVTGRVVAILNKMTFDKKISLSILIGQNFPHEIDVLQKLKDSPHKFIIEKEVRNLANFVKEHSIAIGGAGISALERCSLGVPSVLVVLAENQAPGAMAMEKIGAAIAVRQLENLERDLPHAIKKILDIESRESMRTKSMSLVDCRGLNRVMDLFWTDHPGAVTARQLKFDDIDMVYKWANDVTVRKNSIHQEPISYEEHKKWIKKYLESDNTQHKLFIMNHKNNAIGLVRLDLSPAINSWRISYLVAEEFRGKGLSKLALKSALVKFTNKQLVTTNFYAEVKRDNIYSQKTFSSIGFSKKIPDLEDLLIYRITL